MLFQASDEKLIRNALGGSQRSWERIVRRYEALVYNHCLRMTGNGADALDLCQEVFLAVYRHLPSYRGQGGFKSWMMRIAANKGVDFLRSRKRSPLGRPGGEDALDELYGASAPENLNPDRLYEQDGNNRQVLRLLAELPPEQRLVVELKFFGHFTFEEIGYQCGLSVNTVKSRLYAALQKLKDRLEEQHVV